MIALKQNRSLKQFAISNELSGEKPFSTLLGAVQLHPALDVIVLSQRFVPQDMKAASKLKRLPRRVQFGNLQFLKYIYSEPDPIKTFLDSHPEVSITCNHTLFPKQVKYANHLNMSGRYLTNLENVPVGLWALVLGRINKKEYGQYQKEFENYKPSVLFEFLTRAP